VVGLIPQEAYIFAGTLRENLIHLAPRATAPQVARAVAEVGMEPWSGGSADWTRWWGQAVPKCPRASVNWSRSPGCTCPRPAW
jgi:hypothetical protein